MSRPDRGHQPTVAIREAIALGLLHGPAELLPVSSSGHVEAIPWLLHWSYADLDGEQRKSFEVALHAGTAAALLLAGRRGLGELREPRVASLVAVACAPAALAGYLLEGTIEERLGTPATIAAGLLVGSVAMALGDRAPESRRLDQAELRDALWLGLAQAAALVPGVSRHGATLAVARMRGFTRPDAYRLSHLLALPPIVGATLLRATRRRRVERATVAGAGGAFASTLVAAKLVRPLQRSWPLWPFAAYRTGLAAALGWRLMRGSTARPGGRARP